MTIIEQLARELNRPAEHIENVVRLLDEGNTIPFIARYRKELHGSMDDTALRTLEERLAYLRNLTERKESVKASIAEQEKLTDELAAAIDAAGIAALLQARCEKLTDIPEKVDFFDALPDYDVEFFTNKKSKTNAEVSKAMLEAAIPALEAISDWTVDAIHDTLIDLAAKLEVKNATLMWPVRIAAAGKLVTPGGAVEICHLLGKDETLRRLRLGLDKLN